MSPELEDFDPFDCPLCYPDDDSEPYPHPHCCGCGCGADGSSERPDCICA